MTKYKASYQVSSDRVKIRRVTRASIFLSPIITGKQASKETPKNKLFPLKCWPLTVDC